MELLRTPIQRVIMKSGEVVFIEMGRRQNFIGGGLVLAGFEVDATGKRTGAQRILPCDEITSRIAIGQASDGTLHEAPDHLIWGEDGR